MSKKEWTSEELEAQIWILNKFKSGVTASFTLEDGGIAIRTAHIDHMVKVLEKELDEL